MVPFSHVQPTMSSAAIGSLARHRSDQADEQGADYFAGGTDMIQLMKERVRNPGHIVDVTALPGMHEIVVVPAGTTLGALVLMSDAAAHAGMLQHYPVITESLLASASPQVRNLATLGGNLLQRTRCGYFRDVVTPCTKRVPGSGCPALAGANRLHAMLGTSEHCIATYAGDFASALIVLNASIRILGEKGERVIALADLHRLPGDTPHMETHLQPGDLIVGIDLLPLAAETRSHYLKVRDRASFEWAIVSVAVVLELDEANRVKDVRLAVGGVATRPWRLPQVERQLIGKQFTRELCRMAASHAAEGAVTRGKTLYKVKPIERTVAHSLSDARSRTCHWPARPGDRHG